GDDLSQLGIELPAGSSYVTAPERVPGASDIVAVAAGWRHSLAVARDGALWAFGTNNEGELGMGSTPGQSRPGRVPGLGPAAAASSGFDHSLVLGRDGILWAFGGNEDGEVGDGEGVARRTPVSITLR